MILMGRGAQAQRQQLRSAASGPRRRGVVCVLVVLDADLGRQRLRNRFFASPCSCRRARTSAARRNDGGAFPEQHRARRRRLRRIASFSVTCGCGRRSRRDNQLRSIDIWAPQVEAIDAERTVELDDRLPLLAALDAIDAVELCAARAVGEVDAHARSCRPAPERSNRRSRRAGSRARAPASQASFWSILAGLWARAAVPNNHTLYARSATSTI